MGLGELAGQARRTRLAQHDRQLGQGGADPVRGFIEDKRRAELAEPREQETPRARLARWEAGEIEIGRGQSRGHQGGEQGRRAGHRHHLRAQRNRGSDHAIARIRHRRRPRLGKQRYALARAQKGTGLLGALGFVGVEAGLGATVDAVGRKQFARGAGVLGEHHVHAAQGFDRARREVIGVADGRCNDVERPERL